MSTATITPFLPKHPATNEEFLRWIAPHAWANLWMAVFRGDPKTVDRSEWAGGRPSRMLGFARSDLNNYFTVSSFMGLNRPGDRVRRDEAHWHRLHVLTLDDVGPTNDPAACLILLGQPSYRFETSPGNEQWGYVLDPPWDDRVASAKLLGALWKHLTPNADPGQGNITRYQRLPYGSNGKAVYSPPVATRINVWTGRRLDRAWAQALAAALGVEEPFVAAPGAGGAARAATPVAPAQAPVAASSAALPKVPVAGASRTVGLDLQQDPVFRAMERLGMIQGGPRTSLMGPWTFDIHCPWEHEHTGKVSTGTVYVPVRAKFKCQHGHCVDKTNEHVRLRIDEMLRDASGGSRGLVHEEFPDPVDPTTVPLPLGPASPDPGAADWVKGLSTDKHGAIQGTYRNVYHILSQHPLIAGCLAYDEFRSETMVVRELPDGVPGGLVPRPVTDHDARVIRRWLGKFSDRFRDKDVNDAIELVAQDARYHPIRDWLEGLRWDGCRRLDTWLPVCLGTEFDDYNMMIGRLFLMSLCARAHKPGGKLDYMPIFEGGQGAEKSAMLRILGQPWFTNSMPALDHINKDTSDFLRGCWLIEVSELDGFGRAEAAKLKAFISRTAERFRPAYGHRVGDFPRQCMFAGTVNHFTYLQDDTGNRRFWPVEVGRVDLARVSRERDQLFAEAWHYAVNLGLPIYPDKQFEAEHIAPEQDRRYEPDPAVVPIQEYLEGKTRVRVYDVIQGTLGHSYVNTTGRNRVTPILEQLGWRRAKRRGANGDRYWEPTN